MRPGLTTATQYSGAPLPLPIRVSAGFFVTGLSGNMRIQILPPRLMWRVIAIRAASICRSVIHAGSRLLSPYSPKLISLPRVAVPVMRPRICFRCLTFFGINMIDASYVLLILATRSSAVTTSTLFAFAARAWTTLAFTNARLIDRIGTGAAGHRRFRVHDLTAIDSNLDADLSERGLCFRETIIDVGTQRVQRQLPLQVPLATGDFSAVQTTADFHLDSLRTKTQRLFTRFAHRATKSNALLELRCDLLGLELRVQFRLVDLLDRNEYFASGLHREIALELVDLRALATDDDAGSRGVDDDLETVSGAFDIDVRDAGAGEALLQITFQFQVFEQELAKLFFREPMRMPVLVVAEPKTVWMNFLTHALLLFLRLLRALGARCSGSAATFTRLARSRLLRPFCSLNRCSLRAILRCLRSRTFVIAQRDRHVTKMPLLAIRTTLRRRTHTTTVLRWSTIDTRCSHPQIIRVDRNVRFLSRLVRIRDRRTHALLDMTRRALLRKT